MCGCVDWFAVIQSDLCMVVYTDLQLYGLICVWLFRLVCSYTDLSVYDYID